MLSNIPIDSNITIVLILAVGFAFASILGYLSQQAKFSPILGYLLAGYLIGPYSPGFVADLTISEELAEIGVILMMFGVGLHFKWQELMKVKNIAIPGAFIQTLIASLAGIVLIYERGWSLEAGIVIGLSIGVASTVVMVRLLSDNKLLATPQGHIAVGWLLVEDLITVVALLLLPVIALSASQEAVPFQDMAISIAVALIKCAALILLMAVAGLKIVSFIVFKVAQTRSQELFTLTILALIFVIATGSALLFGVSIALGAFIAGMAIGQTEMRHQASANSLPLKDAFAVVFFLSVGMLFNPHAIGAHYPLFIGILAIILIVKPVTAFLIVLFMRHPLNVGLTVAVALAQIGEFSFILSEQAMHLRIIPDEGYDMIVACGLISIALNPFLFKASMLLKNYLKKRSGKLSPKNESALLNDKYWAIVVGFGPIGQAVAAALEQMGYQTVIIDSNVNTITRLRRENKEALYGDASVQHILEAAHIDQAQLLVITLPEVSIAYDTIKIAKQLNPLLKVLTRVNYVSDQEQLKDLGVTIICGEEEAKEAFINTIWTMPEYIPTPYAK